MDLEELERRLDGGQETQAFEVKGPMDWVASSLAKDILAMANLRDGGTIVVGVEDHTFRRIGVTDVQAATYKIDEMRDQLARFADPFVDFAVTFPVDKAGLTYVAIRVAPFIEVPVICRRDSHDTTAGVIYYRTSNRRVESAPVSNSHDLRDILTVAAARTRRRLEELGWAVEPSPDHWAQQLDEELGGL